MTGPRALQKLHVLDKLKKDSQEPSTYQSLLPRDGSASEANMLEKSLSLTVFLLQALIFNLHMLVSTCLIAGHLLRLAAQK